MIRKIIEINVSYRKILVKRLNKYDYSKNDLPAIINVCGYHWKLKNKYHRTNDLPSFIWYNSGVEIPCYKYQKYDVIFRYNGPSIRNHPDFGTCNIFINGIHINLVKYLCLEN